MGIQIAPCKGALFMGKDMPGYARRRVTTNFGVCRTSMIQPPAKIKQVVKVI